MRKEKIEKNTVERGNQESDETVTSGSEKEHDLPGDGEVSGDEDERRVAILLTANDYEWRSCYRQVAEENFDNVFRIGVQC